MINYIDTIRQWWSDSKVLYILLSCDSVYGQVWQGGQWYWCLHCQFCATILPQNTDISILLEQINKSFKENKSLKHLLVNSFVQLVSDWNFVGNPWIMNENPRKVSEVHQHQSYFIKISAGSHVNHCQAYQNQLSWLFIPPGKFLVLQLAYWQLQTFLNKVLIS